MSKVKLPPNRNITYKNNAGYDLTIRNLPWGRKTVHRQRYRLTNTEDLTPIRQPTAAGGELKISNRCRRRESN